MRRATWIVPACVFALYFALLAAGSDVDPAAGVTASNAPFTDEGWNVLNARNIAVLGHWSTEWVTDDWSRHVNSAPFTAIHAVVFMVFGPGIVQARLTEIAATAATGLVIVLALRQVVNASAALIGGIAFATSALVLYNGRLALLEPVVALTLTAGAMLLALGGQRRPWLVGSMAGLALSAAIATKLLAIPSVAGILLAGALLYRPPSRSFPRLAAAVVSFAIALFAWVLLIVLHDPGAFARTLPTQSGPPDIANVVSRVVGYIRAGDGVVALTAPLLIGGAMGTAAVLLQWRNLPSGARSLAVIAVAWFLAGLGLLAIVSYAPNRYVLPVLPPLALLVGLAANAALTRVRRSVRASAGLCGAALAVLAVPGLVTYAGWMSHSSSVLPVIQAEFASTIPDGVTVAGKYAATFAMRATGPTILTELAPSRDLYVERGVRWFAIADDDDLPKWLPAHRDAWAARRLVESVTWGTHRVRLYVVP